MSEVDTQTKLTQFSLDLFEKEIAHGEVTESRREVAYNKANVLFDVQGLSLVALRIINAIWFIVTHDTDAESYDVDFNYFKWLAKYSRRDNQRFSDAIRECQSAAILLLDPKNPNAN